MLRAFEARDQNAINNPVEASIIAEVLFSMKDAFKLMKTWANTVLRS